MDLKVRNDQCIKSVMRFGIPEEKKTYYVYNDDSIMEPLFHHSRSKPGILDVYPPKVGPPKTIRIFSASLTET